MRQCVCVHRREDPKRMKTVRVCACVTLRGVHTHTHTHARTHTHTHLLTDRWQFRRRPTTPPHHAPTRQTRFISRRCSPHSPRLCDGGLVDISKVSLILNVQYKTTMEPFSEKFQLRYRCGCLSEVEFLESELYK